MPVCLLSLFLVWTVLVDPPAVQKDREEAVRGGIKVDFLGFMLVAVGLGCLQVVLDKGTEDDWFASDFILVFGLVSAICARGARRLGAEPGGPDRRPLR